MKHIVLALVVADAAEVTARRRGGPPSPAPHPSPPPAPTPPPTPAPSVPKNVVLPFAKADCYVEPTYSTDSIQVMADVQYGSAVNMWSKSNEKLMMDVYFPPDADTRKERPVVVHAHGGGYFYGSRKDNDAQMRAIASRGYIAASIDYRLVPILALGELGTRHPPISGSEDSRAAVRFFRSKASEWRIDTNRIALSGNSAGAMSALYHAYAKKDQSEGSGGNPEQSSAINAVVSVSGGLVDQVLCQSVDPDTYVPSGCLYNGEDFTNELQAGDVPVAFIHGTADVTVPFRNSLEAATRANATGVNNVWLPIPGAGHVPMDDCLSTDEYYLHAWTEFLAKALNTAEAECPTKSLMV